MQKILAYTFIYAIIKIGKEVNKMTKYFKITGLDNGIPIEPYGVVTNGGCPMLNVGLYGDKVRYYEPITREEYQKLTNKY